MRARHYVVVVAASLAAGFAWPSIRSSFFQEAPGSEPEGAAVRRDGGGGCDVGSRRDPSPVPSGAHARSTATPSQRVLTDGGSDVEPGGDEKERTDPTTPDEANGTAAPSKEDGVAAPAPDAERPEERKSKEDVRREALAWVGSSWEDVLAYFGRPDQCEPGEWDYAGKDGDPGMFFFFEQGWVKDSGALDPDWRPAAREDSASGGR